MDEIEESSTPIANISKQNEYFSVVPWQNTEQFIKVYEKVFSESLKDRRWAVAQMTIWETRCYPSLPTAIEATFVLAAAVVQDMLLDIGQTFCREKDIQTQYAMAIVRFVNLILQTEGKNLTVLADQHNIPRWIVDLRHDATHANTPSLPLLRMGVKTALSYLKTTYWDKEVANVCQIVKVPSDLEIKVINVISKFKNVQFSIKENTGNYSELETDIEELIEKIRSLVRNHKEKFVEAFVKPGVFLSAEDIFRLLNFDGEIIFLEEDDHLVLPEGLLLFWLAVFRILHTFELIFCFMEMLLLSMEQNTNSLCQKTATAWVLHLLRAMSGHAPESVLAARFKRKGVLINWKRLMYASMQGRNKCISHAFEEVVKRSRDPQRYSYLYCLVGVYRGAASLDNKPADNTDTKNSLVFTPEDLINDYIEEKKRKQKLKEEKKELSLPPEKRQKQKSEEEKNEWSMAPVSINFAEFPLGAIITTDPAENSEETTSEDVDMDMDFEEKFIIEEDDKEPTVEVKSTPDINFFQDPEIGDMIYRR